MTSIQCSDCEYEKVCFSILKASTKYVSYNCKQGRKRREAQQKLI